MCYYFSKSKSIVSAREELSSRTTGQDETHGESKLDKAEAEIEGKAASLDDDPERQCA